MKKYPKYKDSCIEWIGEIPEHWEMKKIGSLSECLTGYAFKSDNFLFEDGIKVVRGDNVTEGALRWGEKTRYWEQITGELERFLLKDGDIVIGMDGSKVGKNYAMVRKVDLPLLLVQRVARIRSVDKLIGRLIEKAINSYEFKYYINLSKTDPAIPHITLKDIKDYCIFLPPINELISIVSFLDRKTKEIDTLVENKQKLIELLKEERTAIINHAVTKGIDPNVKYKDSGIEWIGEVPEHWDVKRLKYIIKGKLTYGANESAEFDNLNDPRYIRISDFGDDGKLRGDTFKSLPYDIAKQYLLEEGDLLLARSGATVGKTFLFSNFTGLACFAGYLIKASFDKNNINSKLIYYFTKSAIYDNWKNSIFQQATIQNIGADKYNQLIIPICSDLVEQNEIVKFIETKTSEIDTIITKTEQEIELLKEYKTALISEVVTGKVDVRDEVLS